MAEPSAKPKEKKITRSVDFRIIFTNAFSIRFGDNDVLIKFSMDLNASDLEAPNVEEVGVVMTPRTAKLLAHALTEAINAFETSVAPIQIPKSKLDQISQSMEVSRAAESHSPVE